jgi:hypothetical protein
MTGAVSMNAPHPVRFGLCLAFVQHHNDGALVQSHLCISPNAAKVFPLTTLLYDGFHSISCIYVAMPMRLSFSGRAASGQAPESGSSRIE